MLRWKDIIKFHLNPPKTSVFVRIPNVHNEYENHKKNHNSIKDHIIKSYLHNNLKWNIVDNRFPYYIDKGISHKVLWINPTVQINKDKIDTIIKRYTDSQNYSKYIYFQNIGNLRSIPEVPHYHIFINTNEEEL